MANGNTEALAQQVLAPAGNEADIRNRICRLLDGSGAGYEYHVISDDKKCFDPDFKRRRLGRRYAPCLI